MRFNIVNYLLYTTCKDGCWKIQDLVIGEHRLLYYP